MLAILLVTFMPGCGSEGTTSVESPPPVQSPLPAPSLPLASPAAASPTASVSPASGASPTPTPSASPLNPPLATLTVQLVLEQLRAVQAYVQTVRLSGTDAAGRRIYGPVERPKQATLVYTDVPSNVVEIQIDFLTGPADDLTVTGIFRGPINLTSGAATLNDPPFVDVNTVQSLSVTGPSSLARGSQAQLVCNGTFTNGKTYDLTTAVRWVSSNTSVATVSATGQVTAIAPGPATITATRDALSSSLTVTVTPATLAALTVSPASVSIITFASQAFTARGTFSDNTTQDLTTQVAWSSSNVGVASISSTGLASGLGPGTTAITARQAGVSGTATLAVSGPAAVNATIVPQNPQVPLFSFQTFGLNVTLSNGSVQNLTALASWTSSEPSIAAVTQPGEIRALNRGTAVLTAALGGVQAQTNVTAVDNPMGGGPPATPAVRFAAAVNFALPGHLPDQMVSGDFNADLRPDLATANSPDNDIGVLLNTGGAFGAATFVGTAAGAGPFGLATGQVGGGAALDIVTADSTLSTLSLFLGNGAGGFGAPAAVTTGAGTNPRGVVLADFDLDTDLDAATANGGSANLSVLLNTAGVFGAPTLFATGLGGRGIAAGNFNGDAFVDLAVSCATSGAVTVRFGAAAASFPTFVNVTTGAGSRRILARDLNGDGLLDFVTANSTADTISLVYGNGAGGFAAAINQAVGSAPFEVAAGDFNGDGRLDLAVANEGSNSVSVLTGNGSGAYTLAATLAVGAGPRSVVAADFNADGRLDLATANNGGNNVSLLLQQP